MRELTYYRSVLCKHRSQQTNKINYSTKWRLSINIFQKAINLLWNLPCKKLYEVGCEFCLVYMILFFSKWLPIWNIFGVFVHYELDKDLAKLSCDLCTKRLCAKFWNKPIQAFYFYHGHRHTNIFCCYPLSGYRSLHSLI